MKALVAIDPGIKNLGVAVFFDGELSDAFLWPVGTDRARSITNLRRCLQPTLDSIPRVVCERPQLYGGRSSRGDGNDLLDLSRVVGAIEHEFCGIFGVAAVSTVLPREWAGQVPKDIRHQRLVIRLSDAEYARIRKCSPSLLHNVLDAVGIGLHAQGR